MKFPRFTDGNFKEVDKIGTSLLRNVIKQEKSFKLCNKHFFDKRGHPVSFVQAGHHHAQQIDRQSALQMAEKDNTDQFPFNKRQWNLT